MQGQIEHQVAPVGAEEPELLVTAGTRIEHYELVREIGGTAARPLYLARDVRAGRRVVIVFLDRTRAAERFIDDALVVAQYLDDSLLLVHEFGECQGTTYMVLDGERGGE